MPLVKRNNGEFVESYDITGFSVNIANKAITVALNHHTISTSGVPSTSQASYQIFDHTEHTMVNETKEVQVPSRDSSGAIVMDKSGNPVMVPQLVTVPTQVPNEIKSFSEIVAVVTTGNSLYKEIQSALYASFKKYQLKDDTFVIE